MIGYGFTKELGLSFEKVKEIVTEELWSLQRLPCHRLDLS